MTTMRRRNITRHSVKPLAEILDVYDIVCEKLGDDNSTAALD